jgi:serine/threonine-protein kinase
MATDDGLTGCPQCGKKFPSTVRMCPDDGSVLEHATPTPGQTGQVLDGKYRLDALLAEGGMGAVYRATHVMLGKTIAIKLIRSAIVASPEIVRRFQREARAATALNHPNIVSVYDLGQTPDGTLYIAMEYIDGPSLKTLIMAGRAIPPMRTIAILRQVASALATAHRHNIIHRDLKPHNIMLATGIDGSEQAKLVDFGIAKTFDESTQLTSMGSALGTPYYMSPEQIEGATVDARSDIYALGIILYEMLVGEVPFADQSTPAVLVRQLKERPARPSLKNPAVPPSLEAIALRCLEKDPAQRFQSADEFAAALNDATAAMNEVAGMSTMPMMRATPSAPASDQSEATLVSPSKAAAAAPTLVTPVAPAAASTSAAALPVPAPPAPPVAAASAPGTKPTVAVPSMQPPVASPSSEAAPARKSSMAPLVAAAAVLLLLAGGYLWWSGRQAPASTAASSAPAEAPKAVPAMAGQEPAATADAAKANAAAPSAGAPAPSSATPSAPPATAAKEPAATAAATREALAARMPPATAPPAAVKGATTAAANAMRAAAGSSAAPVAAAPAREPVAQPGAAPAPTPMIPENAAVLFRCSGAPDVCASLRSTVNEALDKAGFRTVTSVDRADIAVGAVAAPLQDKVSQQFGQTFLTRTYSIELSGEAPKLGDAVSMPPSTTVTFDASVGRERLDEKSRLVAGDIIERIRAFIKKKRAS